MRGISIDFLMKLFFSVVAIAFIILGVYIFGQQMADYLGYQFTLKPPSVTGGNLGKYAIKVVGYSISPSDYDSCLSYCKGSNSEPHLASTCSEQCNLLCKLSEGCYKLNLTAEVFGSSNFNSKIMIYIENNTKYIPLDGIIEQLPPGESLVHLIFYLPKFEDKTCNLSVGLEGLNVNKTIGTINFLPICSQQGEKCSVDSDCCPYTHNVTSESFELTASNNFFKYTVLGKTLSIELQYTVSSNEKYLILSYSNGTNVFNYLIPGTGSGSMYLPNVNYNKEINITVLTQGLGTPTDLKFDANIKFDYGYKETSLICSNGVCVS